MIVSATSMPSPACRTGTEIGMAWDVLALFHNKVFLSGCVDCAVCGDSQAFTGTHKLWLKCSPCTLTNWGHYDVHACTAKGRVVC